jgi:hypothetical protein
MVRRFLYRELADDVIPPGDGEYILGLKILNQLVDEAQRLTSGADVTQHRRPV